MVRVTIPWRKLLRETKLGRSDAPRTKWRCGKCNAATYYPELMSGHLVDCVGGGDIPNVEIIKEF